MTTSPLADTIAKAILTTVERDRCCNLENIRETVFRELAVEDARRTIHAGPQSGGGGGTSRLILAARRIHDDIAAYVPHSFVRGFSGAYLELEHALRELGAL